MKTITKEAFICEVCGEEYFSVAEANDCERKPITEDKGVKKGDIVLITNGEGTGKLAIVKSRFIIDKYWGHYAWRRYWHTVAITAEIIDSWGTRMLTYDSYDLHKIK